ncbi:hypothetical protein CDL12_13155 [Handroanthus impetiginosus]|uniref:Uncharacterized protein n=1 Tax=Handroanthus impetiginosus TaxID=429701 RepID=A0A2G9H9M8_9LAMI|nr:hypothetical protein CDL12_13155 [Handroanthus impetiginosus]
MNIYMICGCVLIFLSHINFFTLAVSSLQNFSFRFLSPFFPLVRCFPQALILNLGSCKPPDGKVIPELHALPLELQALIFNLSCELQSL